MNDPWAQSTKKTKVILLRNNPALCISVTFTQKREAAVWDVFC